MMIGDMDCAHFIQSLCPHGSITGSSKTSKQIEHTSPISFMPTCGGVMFKREEGGEINIWCKQVPIIPLPTPGGARRNKRKSKRQQKKHNKLPRATYHEA